MFGKRKEFPEGTFIPTRTRVVVIFHLCLACSLLVWFSFQPFMGELFAYRSEMTLYKTVMGDERLLERVADPSDIPEATAKLADNKTRFERLSPAERTQLEEGFAELQSQATRTFWEKAKRATNIVLFEIPLYLQGWILLSCAISVLLLLRIEGAQMAAWLLPLLVAAYGIHNVRRGLPPVLPPDAPLFPTEQVLLHDHLQEELSDDIWEQREQLQRGWRLYLASDWANETPSSDPDTFANQVDAGEYRFNIARIAKWRDAEPASIERIMQGKRSPVTLFLFFGWNLFVAIFVNRRRALA